MRDSDFLNSNSPTADFQVVKNGGAPAHEVRNRERVAWVAGKDVRMNSTHHKRGPNKFIKVKLLLAEAESDEQKLRRLCIFHPEGFYLTIWSLFLGLLVLYLLLVIPFEVAFGSSGSSYYFNNIVIFRVTTAAFGLDIFVHCNTAYVDPESATLVIDHKAILNHYLSSKWFIIDLLATFPFDIIVQEALASKKITLIRLVRTLRLIRLVKLFETKDSHKRILSSIIPPSTLGLLSLIVRVGFIAHVFACFWYFIATASSVTCPVNWTDELRMPTLSDKYIASFYFIIVTMLTVGYGDIHASNQPERIFAILTMVVGVVVVAFLINKMNAIIASQNQHSKQFKQKIDQFKVDMIKVKVPKEIRVRAQAALEYYLTKRSTVDEQSIFDELSLPIRRSLVEKIHATELTQLRSSLPLSSSASSSGLLVELVEVSKPFVGWTGDVLYSQGDIIEDIIFIKSGMILASIHTPVIVNASLNRWMACLSDGELFGDVECMLKQACLATYTVHRHSLMIAMPAARFRELLTNDSSNGGMKEFCEKKWRKWQVVTQQVIEDTSRLFSSHHIQSSSALSELESHVQRHLVGRIYMNGEIISLGTKSIPLHNAPSSGANSNNNTIIGDNKQREKEQRILRCLTIDDKRQLIVVERSIDSFHREWIVLPFDTWKKGWDGIVALFILFSLLVVPPQIVFQGNDLVFELMTDFITNFVFFVDFVVNFRLSYFDKDRDAFCISKELIAKHYLHSGWFVVDGLASLPFGLLLLLYVTNGKSRLDTFIGLFRLVKLIRVLKVMQLHNYLSNLGDMLGEWISISPLMFALFEVLLQAFLIAHWLACLWWGVTSTISKRPWYTTGQVYGRLQGEKAISQYLVSLYFVFTTITTTGYGDIHSSNANERVVAIFLSIIGVIVFSYMIANVTSLVSTFISTNDTFIERIGHVKNYLTFMQCPDKLRTRVVNQYNHRLEQLSSVEISKTVAVLPHIWRTKILYHVHHAHLKQIPFFRYLPSAGNQSLLLFLFRYMSAVYLEEGCHLLREEEESSSSTGQSNANSGGQKDIIFCIVSGGALVYRIHPRHRIRHARNNNNRMMMAGTPTRQRSSRNNSSRFSSPPLSSRQQQPQQLRSHLLPTTVEEGYIIDDDDDDDEKDNREEKQTEEENSSSLSIKMKFAPYASNQHGGVEESVFGACRMPSLSPEDEDEDEPVVAPATPMSPFSITIDTNNDYPPEDDDNDDKQSDDHSSNLSFDEVMQFRPSAPNLILNNGNDNNDNILSSHGKDTGRQLSDLQQLELALKERNRVNNAAGRGTQTAAGHRYNQEAMPLRFASEDAAGSNTTNAISILPQPLRSLLQRSLQNAAAVQSPSSPLPAAADRDNPTRSRNSTLADYQSTITQEEAEGKEDLRRVTVDNCGRILKDYCCRHNRPIAQVTPEELDLIGLKLIGKVSRDDIVGYRAHHKVSVVASAPTVVYTLHWQQIIAIRKEAPVAGFELHSALQAAVIEQSKAKREERKKKNRINFLRFLRFRFVQTLWQAMLRFAWTHEAHNAGGYGYDSDRHQQKAAKHILRINEEIEKILTQWTHERQAILDIENNQHGHRERHLPLQDLPAGRRFLHRNEWQLLPSNPQVAIEMLQALREESMRVWQEVHRMPHDMLQVVDSKLTKEIEELKNDGQTVFRIDKQGGEIHLLPAAAATAENTRTTSIMLDRANSNSNYKSKRRPQLCEYSQSHNHDDDDHEEHEREDPCCSRREAKRIIHSPTQRAMRKMIKLRSVAAQKVIALGGSVFSSKGRRGSIGGSSSHNNDSDKGNRSNRKRSKSVGYSVTGNKHHDSEFIQLQRRVLKANDDCMLDWQLRRQLYI